MITQICYVACYEITYNGAIVGITGNILNESLLLSYNARSSIITAVRSYITKIRFLDLGSFLLYYILMALLTNMNSALHINQLSNYFTVGVS